MHACKQRGREWWRCLQPFFVCFFVKDKTEKTVEIAIHLSPKQLDRAVPVLEEIIQEMVEDHEKGTHLQLALQTE